MHMKEKSPKLTAPSVLSLGVKEWKAVQSEENKTTPSQIPDGVLMHNIGDALMIENTTGEKITLHYKKQIVLHNKCIVAMRIDCRGEFVKNAAGCLFLNGYELPLNGSVVMPIEPPINMTLTLKISAHSACLIKSVAFSYLTEEPDLIAECGTQEDVLVVVPNYPSAANLYLSAFAHARDLAYVEAGMKVQVAVMTDTWYNMRYDIDGIPVCFGPYSDLKKLLSRKQYKVVIIHFVDVTQYPILDGYITNEKLIFINHGPETMFEVLPNKVRPYFTAPYDDVIEDPVKRDFVRRYARKDNVEWVFVSEFLRDKAEELMDIEFKHSHVIGNIINEANFPYREKTAEDRKKIMVLRKFDNICQHSVDQVVLAISALSRKPFFSELEFNLYGDGNFYEELTAPLHRFPNVHLHRTFVPNNEIQNIHAEHGILLIPSRHDTHGVSMNEAAASGLVVVGSRVNCTPYYMDEAHNHTLADPEDYEELAGIIERLYNDPEEFLAISRRLSQYVREVNSAAETIDREIALVHACMDAVDWDVLPEAAPEGDPILTILVAAYNVESWLDKCLYSLVNHRNAGKTEILVVNDGSKDRTSEIAHRYEQATHGVVRAIDKVNGGHGSTINVGIAEARGRYFRIVDGDDWVDSENLATLVDRLADETADIVLTKGSYEYADKASLENIIDYDMLREGTLYHYDDLLFPEYGFKTYGALLTTGNYRVECLRKADFRLSEKKPYVDMEFNAFSQRYVQTLRYWDLDIYRYLIGRAGQTVSRDFWKAKYEVHASIIFNILETLDRMEDFPENRKRFLYAHLVAMMADSQIFMYDQVCRWDQIDPFLERLGKWPAALEASFAYIEEKDDASRKILKQYRHCSGTKPLINTDGTERQMVNVRTLLSPGMVKKTVRSVVPYGIIELWRISTTK